MVQSRPTKSLESHHWTPELSKIPAFKLKAPNTAHGPVPLHTIARATARSVGTGCKGSLRVA